ncbi:MAG: NUDIX hydrolase [Alphaproteobacteria bacterium]|nr:NUDIX hydrolase [Alphaproteobacteria bacterium]
MKGQKPSGPTVLTVPEGDERERLTCPDCGFIHYENPKIVTGAVVEWEDRILLCRRAIAPGIGKWTLPAGYLEVNESSSDGAKREAWEEARARIEIDALIALYDIPHISQIQLFFRARLLSPDISAGPENQEVALFSWEQIPWDELAFPSVTWALNHFADTRGKTDFAPHRNPAGQAMTMAQD